ncbi:MAG: hypothetical protein DDT42_01892 [candidate division WS2 bacterium]|uniref:Uncharacterized protein n=1 Tax=Psychracetigena formicireducens TaxID=2986056 RepID=A0A9E2BI73_PSYF1|nr:hypothetical protein [Candidatus Psychracetigena formicireducens]
MKSIDNVFQKEFRAMMEARRGRFGDSVSYINLPLPTETASGGLSVVKVKGVVEPFFDRLNGLEVCLTGRMALKKRQALSDGTFRLDADGGFVYHHIAVKQDCVAVVSPVSIGLKRYTLKDGVKTEHIVSDDFKYVDFLDIPSGRQYIYILPKKNVFRLSMCALIVTPNKHRVFYKGLKVALQSGTYVYLYVIPYKYRETSGGRMVCLKASCDMDQEILEVIKGWEQHGLLFNTKLSEVEVSENTVTNLSISCFDGSCLEQDYVQCTVSLAAETEVDE